MGEEKNKKKLSYEELENIAHQLSEQSRVLSERLEQSNMHNAFKRLDYLFKIIENSKEFKPEFVDKCVSEIEELISIPESEEVTE